VTRAVERCDRTTVRGMPALTCARAIIELAHTLTPKQLRVLIDSARRRGMTIERLRERAMALREEPGCRRGARAVLAMVGSGDLDKESENERTIGEFLASTTLVLEWQVADLVPGRRLDAVDREARLILEIDSAMWHTLGSDRDADGMRELEIGSAVDGYQVFRLTLGMVRISPEETRRKLDAIRAKRVPGTR
jgi:very-short-patch-repair endonuclease